MNTALATAPALGVKLIKLALAYLLLGLLLGIGMAASHHFELQAVHSHINLLGWATMALSGLIYCVFPRAAAGRLARAHFWLHNLGLPVMMAGLAAYSLGHTHFEPLIAAGSLFVSTGLLLFSLAVYKALLPQPAGVISAETAPDLSAAQ